MHQSANNNDKNKGPPGRQWMTLLERITVVKKIQAAMHFKYKIK